MLFLLFYYFAVSVCCAWAGLLGLQIFARFLPVAEIKARDSVVMILISGLMLLTIIGEWLVLFFPMTPWMLIVVFGLLHLLAGVGPVRIAAPITNRLTNPYRRNNSILLFGGLLAFLLLVLVFNAGPSRMDDTESYHIQSVKWIAEYGTVPGIANLHLRFGLNSAWFVAIALLTHSTPTFNNYLSLNGLLCVWFCFYLVERFFALADRSGKLYNPARAIGIGAVLAISAGNWYFLRRSASSTSYDFIGTVVVFVLFVETANDKKPPVEWLLWPLFLFTVRITHFPFLLLPMAFLLRHGSLRSIPGLFKIAVAAAVVIIPFFIRNWLLSGYLFFPLTVFGGLPGNWKADAVLAGDLTEYARLFNRVNPMYQPMSWTRTLTGGKWIGPWWTYLVPEDKIVVIAGLAGFVTFWIRYRRHTASFPVFHTVMLASIFAWFFIAPDPRFIQGVWLTGVLAGFSSLNGRPAFQWRGFQVVFFSASLFVSGYAISKIIRAPECRNFFFPRVLPVPAVTQVAVGSVILNIPSRVLDNWNPRCFDLPIPCLYKVDPRLVLRGKTLDKGFRLDENKVSAPVQGEYNIKK